MAMESSGEASPRAVAAPESSRRASLLRTVAWAILIGVLAFTLVSALVLRQNQALRLGIGLCILLLELAVLASPRWLSAGRAAGLQVGGLWLILTGFFAYYGGITLPGYAAFLVLIAAAGLLLQRRAAAGFGGLVMATTALLALAQSRGLIPVTPVPVIDTASVLFIYLLLAGFMTAFMFVARGIIDRALDDLEASNAALAAGREGLEQQVAARTAEIDAANQRLRLEVEERTRALQALQASEEKHRLLLDSIGSPVLALDGDLAVLYCNEAYARLVGRPVTEIEGARLLDLFPGFAETRSWSAIREALASGQPQTVEGPMGERVLLARVYPTPWGVLSIADDVTEQRRVETERLRFAGLLRTAAETAGQLSEILEPEALLQKTVQLMQDRFELYHVHVYLFQPDPGRLEVRAGSGEVGRRLVESGHQIPLAAEQSLVALAARGRELVVVDDVRSDPAFLPNPLLPETRSEVAVPLLARGALIGVLDVQDDQPGRFKRSDLDALRSLAGQIAVAIENARLFTVQRETQLRLADSQRRLDRLFASLPQVLLYETGGGHEAIFGNTQALLGYPPECFTGDRSFFPSLIHPEDGAAVDAQLAAWNATGRSGLLTLELRCRRADGAYLWLRDYMVGGQRDSGAPFIAGVLVDMTASRQAELERQQFIEQLQTAAQVSESLNSLLGPEAVLNETVQLMQHRFGLYHVHVYLYDRLRDELIVRAGSGPVGARLVAERHSIPLRSERSLVALAALAQDLVQVPDVREEPRFLPNPLLPETRSELALPLLARDGLVGVLDVQDNRPGRFTASELDTFRILAGQIAVALENAKVFDEMKLVTERLKELDRLKSEFLANMSHELRTPLNSIIGYAELILMGINGAIDPETQQDVQAIHDNGQQLLALINDLLDLAKIEAGRMRLELEEVLIGPLLEEVRTISAGLLLRKPIEIGVAVAPDLPAIRGDRLRLQQILNNLVSNAVKFTERGRIWLRADREGDEIVIRVEDTGIGIQPEEMDEIFEKFHQADGSLTRRARGTGLGLAITHHLVKLHAGRIEVASTPGEGTTFTVRLPLQAPSWDAFNPQPIPFGSLSGESP